MEINDQAAAKYGTSPKYFTTPHVFLTIGKCVEDGCGAEAAVADCGVHPHLDLVGSGPAQVRQHRLVPVALRVMALVFTAVILSCTNARVSCRNRFRGVPSALINTGSQCEAPTR